MTRQLLLYFTENSNLDNGKYMEDIKGILKNYKEAKDHQNEIKGEFHDFKIMESFLEGNTPKYPPAYDHPPTRNIDSSRMGYMAQYWS